MQFPEGISLGTPRYTQASAFSRRAAAEVRRMRGVRRRAMEAEVCIEYAPEWRHFAYRNWAQFRIENRWFEEPGCAKGGASR